VWVPIVSKPDDHHSVLLTKDGLVHGIATVQVGQQVTHADSNYLLLLLLLLSVVVVLLLYALLLLLSALRACLAVDSSCRDPGVC